MRLKIPHVLRYEVRHCLESLGTGAGDNGVRARINEHPGLALGLTGGSVAIIVLVLFLVLRPASPTSFQRGKLAWFYDVNTGKLFLGSFKEIGPIDAPSGPTPDGKPAGFRAHVYSYVLDPNEAELFAGFLERPDPDAKTKPAASDMMDFEKWTRGRLIRGVKDREWVRASSPEGQAVLQEMLEPNKKGQTPIYQVPRE